MYIILYCNEELELQRDKKWRHFNYSCYKLCVHIIEVVNECVIKYQMHNGLDVSVHF